MNGPPEHAAICKLPGQAGSDQWEVGTRTAYAQTKLEGLQRMVEVCGPLHPGSAKFPKNQIEPYELSWKLFTKKAID